MRKCENCNHDHDGCYGSGRFCSSQCARGFATKEKREEINKKVGLKLRKIYKKICPICNKEFDSKREKTKFCSRSCSCIFSNDAYPRTMSKKQKLQHSKMVKDQYLNGKRIYGGRTKWISVETSNGEIKVQGTYEERVCRILDFWKVNNFILNWEYTNDRFKYVAEDGNEHTYIVDFKIYENKDSFYYVEVKGYERKNDQMKWNAVKEKGYKIEIWFLDAIKKYEMEFGS